MNETKWPPPHHDQSKPPKLEERTSSSSNWCDYLVHVAHLFQLDILSIGAVYPPHGFPFSPTLYFVLLMYKLKSRNARTDFGYSIRLILVCLIIFTCLKQPKSQSLLKQWNTFSPDTSSKCAKISGLAPDRFHTVLALLYNWNSTKKEQQLCPFKMITLEEKMSSKINVPTISFLLIACI